MKRLFLIALICLFALTTFYNFGCGQQLSPEETARKFWVYEQTYNVEAWQEMISERDKNSRKVADLVDDQEKTKEIYPDWSNAAAIESIEEEFALVDFVVIKKDEKSAVVEMSYPTLEQAPLTYLVLEDGVWKIDLERTILEEEQMELSRCKEQRDMVLAAAELFNADNGRYPNDIDELVPKYIDEEFVEDCLFYYQEWFPDKPPILECPYEP